MRKKVAIILTAAVLTVTPALADQFLDDFNTYADGLYGIPQITPVVENMTYKSTDVEIMNMGEVTIYGENPLSVISAACCALRAIDNEGSQIDQYGRVLHAYFLNRSQGKESRATTETGVLIYFADENGLFTVRLVK
jgi:hypothetical protein